MSSVNSNANGKPDQACGVDVSNVSQSSAPARREYWRSLDDLGNTEEFRRWMHNEFPANADLLEGEDRRHFIKIMGASFALAGFGLAACRRIPETHIVPYSDRPANRIPGHPVQYASAMEIGGVSSGVLVKTYDGRPIKLEGNPTHPGTLGACEGPIQAAVLQVYDPDRSRFVMNAGQRSDAASFQSFVGSRFNDQLRKTGGAGLAVLAETSGSPSVTRMRGELSKAFPKMQWFEWEPATGDHERDGTEMAFGSPRRLQPNLAEANVVICLDADPLMTHPAAALLAKQWASRRQVDNPDPKKQELSRVYAVEGVLSVTGMAADDRMAIRSVDVPKIAAALMDAIAPGGGFADAAKGLDLTDGQKKILEAMITDLKANQGSSLVMAGERQPAAVHALVAMLNEKLGNAGKTVNYIKEDRPNRMQQIAGLTKAMKDGSVETLVIVGGNPVYDAPADLDFASALGKVKESIHLSLYDDETSRACTWHLPRAHWLESWGDVTAWDGTRSVTQPTIMPMIPEDQVGWSSIELLAELADSEPRDGYSIVRATELDRSQTTGATFERHWRELLDRGVIADTAWTVDAAGVTGSAAKVAEQIKAGASGAADAVELVLPVDNRIYDGRFANIGWLQELPDQVTKVTWDNTLSASPAFMNARGLKLGDVVRVAVGDRSVEAAVFPVPWMAERTIALSLGWGRTEAAGQLANGAGFNAYTVRTTAQPDIIPDVQVASTGGTYEFAHTQDHGTADSLMQSVPEAGIQERLPTLFRETTLDHYHEHPDFAKHAVHVAHRLSLWEETNLDGAKFKWGMAIDLNTCTGCSACVIACQAENNIPVVGKDQVIRGREMAWLRIDRYFKGDDPAQPEAAFVLPVTCMQCENAPCEQVCPVAATVHDKDGLNVMVYNRCIGTRYCSNNCPYKVRRFNWFDYWRRDPVREQDGLFAVKGDYYLKDGPDEWRRMQLNPDVTVRMRGVMEKCNFCTQRINAAKIKYKNEWAKNGGTATSPDWSIPDGAFTSACAEACSTNAIVFGDLADPNSEVSKLQKRKLSYGMLEELNTKPRVEYLAQVRNPGVPPDHGDGHGHGHGDGHNGHASTTNGQGGAQS